MPKKLSYDKAKNIVENNGYILLNKDTDYIRANTKLDLCDKEGYFYSYNVSHFKYGHLPRIVDKSNKYTIQNIKLWCELNNKSFELISNTYKRNNYHLKWKCLKEGCGETFFSSWASISQGVGCPYCAGQKVGLSNCLATKNPELASEWHPTKNGDLTPYDVSCGSKKNIWWQCNKNPKHIWQVLVKDRNKGNGCPFCSGLLPTDENNLLLLYPESCKEWHYEKNDKKPEEYLPKSHYSVWWICKECKYEWKAIIANRIGGSGCPECNNSKGEKRVVEYLKDNLIKYEVQKTFAGLVGINNGNLSYDFYLPDYNLLLEYQGEQHERPVDFKGLGKKYAKEQFKIQQEHDKRKKEYAQKHNINLLEIWYYDFDKIEEILKKVLNYKNNLNKF